MNAQRGTLARGERRDEGRNAGLPHDTFVQSLVYVVVVVGGGGVVFFRTSVPFWGQITWN